MSLSQFIQQLSSSPALWVTVILTLGVILVNGWTDAPNAIATCVTTRAMRPRMAIAMAAIFLLLGSLNASSVQILPNFGWYLFCGFCLALSVIAPGMSFSTLLMPLGLYTPLVDGIGNLDFGVLVPAGIGAVVTVVCLAKAINALFTHFYSFAFHAIIGIVIAATLVIIPFGSVTQGVGTAAANLVCLAVGVVAALALDKFNQSVPKEETGEL